MIYLSAIVIEWVNHDGFILARKYFDNIMELDFAVRLCIVQTNLFTGG